MKAEIKRSVSPANTRYGILKLTIAGNTLRCVCLLLLVAFSPGRVVAQSNLTLYGDVKIDTSKGDSTAPLSVTIILYKESGGVVGRQTMSTRGQYRFTNLSAGEYEIAIEAENNEIGRVRMSMMPGTLSSSPYGYRQDLEFEWKPALAASKPKTGIISAADAYNRPSANESLFQKALGAVEKKKYEQAVTLLKQIVGSDKLDFQAWTLLGTVYRLQEKSDDAEKAYLSAIEAKPTFALALLDLGRLRSSQKKFEEAIEPLTRAVESQPQSAEANLLLGEAYLQVRKGSKAIGYLDEAARLGRAEAHLRLGWLYNAAGMKDKAAVEYEEFLKKKPDYSDRKKLEEYISAHKKG